MKKDLLPQIEAIARPICEKVGVSLYDTEFVKEGGAYYLRVFIDAPQGVTIEQCEAVSRLLDPALDEADPIEQSYYMEVSSVGLDRPLKKEKDFLHFMGALIEVKTYRPQDGQKEFSGILKDYRDGRFTIEMPDGTQREFDTKDTALIRPGVTF